MSSISMPKINIIKVLEAVRPLERRLSMLLLAEHGMSISQFRLLLPLLPNTGLTASQLCTTLGITKASGSILIQELTRAGVVAVTPNPEDRRSIVIRLTPEGKNRMRAAETGIAALEKTLARQIPDNTVKALAHLTRLKFVTKKKTAS